MLRGRTSKQKKVFRFWRIRGSLFGVFFHANFVVCQDRPFSQKSIHYWQLQEEEVKPLINHKNQDRIAFDPSGQIRNAESKSEFLIFC